MPAPIFILKRNYFRYCFFGRRWPLFCFISMPDHIGINIRLPTFSLNDDVYLCIFKNDFMKFGVVVFPGSNCDRDIYDALTYDLSQEAIMLWHKDKDLSMFSTEDCI